MSVRKYKTSQIIRTKLQEYYRRPELNWVDTFVDELYDNPDDFIEIGDKYKISFELDDDTCESLIKKSGYIDTLDIYRVFIPLSTVVFIDKGLYKNDFKIELKEWLAHENIHKQQNQLKSKDQPYYNGPDSIRYYSQQVEIDAMAHSVAYELETKIGINNASDAVDYIIEGDINKLSVKAQHTVDNYKNEIKGIPWRRFLSEIYDYYNKPHDKEGKLNLKWALKKN